jgi:hypothetical protein
VSYDLWAWKWAENDRSATPTDIVELALATSKIVDSQVPGLTEYVIDEGPPHPAIAPFEIVDVLTVLRERLGRHSVLTGDNPSLQEMELYRDQTGNAWRLDFAVERELVEHLLPVGLGTAFAKAGLVLFDAWRQRIVRPGSPKTLSFEWGGKVGGIEYEPDWALIGARLQALSDGDYAILQNKLGDYVQCAGSAKAMTVECRIWSERGYHHWVAGTQGEDAEVHEVIGPSGPVAVRAYEAMNADAASRIFQSFMTTGLRDSKFRWRDITATFI